MASFDLNIFLGIIYLALVYLAIVIIYALIVTDYFMRIWQSKQIAGIRRVLLITAHPDDECMFFGPTLVSLAKDSDVGVYVLCLSTGDHDGVGSTRKQELWRSCKKLGIPESNITCLDYHALRDDPQVLWKSSHMAKILIQYVNALTIDTIITFDESGVSGHLNHISINQAVTELLDRRQFPPHCRVFCLESVTGFRKYILGVFDVYLSYITSSVMYVTNEGGRSLIRSAMEAHASQYVWYRKLYMVFSRYVNVNTFKELRYSSLDRNDATAKRKRFPLFRNSQQQQQQQRQKSD